MRLLQSVAFDEIAPRRRRRLSKPSWSEAARVSRVRALPARNEPAGKPIAPEMLLA